MRVCFVVHGNAQIGMGHVMRSLALAEIFRDRGHSVCFVSKFELGAEVIRSKGFNKVVSVFSDAYMQVDAIIVDSYDVTPEFFCELKRYTKTLIYIDDLNAFSYPVDFLINGTASACDMGYEKNQNAKLLLGLEYNLLRKEFADIPKREFEADVKKIFVSTGNSDPCHMTEKLLQTLTGEEKFLQLEYHVIIGGGFEKDIWKNEWMTNHSRIYLYEKPMNIVEIMQKCDMAVTAGGSTLYELAACGIPAISFSYADNQLPQIRALTKMGLLKYVGMYDMLDMEKLINELNNGMNHIQDRFEWVNRLQNLVDGKGTVRIVDAIEGCERT